MKIYYGNGEIRIDNGVSNIAAIEINFNGTMTATSELPSTWTFMNNKNKIIGINLGNLIPELLFSYEGDIKILSAKVVERDYTIHNLELELEGVDYWNLQTGQWEGEGGFLENKTGTFNNGNKPNFTTITQINLETSGEEWFLKDGSPYTGKYNIKGDGSAMTGNPNQKGQFSIYRKNGKGTIFDPLKPLPRKIGKRIVRGPSMPRGGGY